MRPSNPERARRRAAHPLTVVLVLVVVAAGCLPGREASRPSTRPGSHPAGSRPGAGDRRPLPVRWSTTADDWPVGLVADPGGVAVVLSGSVSYLGASDGRERWVRRARSVGADDVALGPGAVVLTDGGRRLRVLGRRDGRTRWEHPVGGPVRYPAVAAAGPPPAAGLVTAFHGSRGHVHLTAFDAATGERSWRVGLAGEPVGPLVADPDGRFLAGVWRRPPGDPGGSVLRVLDPADGRVVWERHGGRSSRPVVDGGVVAVVEAVSGRAVLRAYRIADGEVAWATPVASPLQETAAPAAGPAGLVVAGELGTIALVDPRSGRLRWERRLAAADVAVLESPVVGRSEIVVPLALSSLAVLRAADGSVVELLPEGIAVGPASTGAAFVTGWRWVDPAPVESRPLR